MLSKCEQNRRLRFRDNSAIREAATPAMGNSLQAGMQGASCSRVVGDALVMPGPGCSHGRSPEAGLSAL